MQKKQGEKKCPIFPSENDKEKNWTFQEKDISPAVKSHCTEFIEH